jgi:biopolymer transport protein ExbD
MAFKKPRRQGINIDMTPYVDVMMVIITFFMLTAQFKAELSEDVQVSLPTAGNDTTKLPERNVMTIVVTQWGDIFVDVDNSKVRDDVFGDPLGLAVYHPDSTTQPGYITHKIGGDREVKRPILYIKEREKFKKLLIDLRLSSMNNVGKDLRIVVKGDKDASIGTIQDLMDILRETKNTRFSLVTQMEQGENKPEGKPEGK